MKVFEEMAMNNDMMLEDLVIKVAKSYKEIKEMEEAGKWKKNLIYQRK